MLKKNEIWQREKRDYLQGCEKPQALGFYDFLQLLLELRKKTGFDYTPINITIQLKPRIQKRKKLN